MGKHARGKRTDIALAVHTVMVRYSAHLCLILETEVIVDHVEAHGNIKAVLAHYTCFDHANEISSGYAVSIPQPGRIDPCQFGTSFLVMKLTHLIFVRMMGVYQIT